MFQLRLAARYLWGRKLRTLLTTIAVVFGVLVIFGMNILLPTMVTAFQSTLLAASGQVDVTVSLKTGESFSPAIAKKVEAVEGVRAVSGLLIRTVNIPGGFYRQGQVSALSLVGLDPKAAQALREYTMKQGRFLQADDREAAVISSNLAETLGLGLGDSLAVPTAQGVVQLKVVGIRSTAATVGNEQVLMTLVEAQKLLNLPNRINTIEANLNTTKAADRGAIVKEIETRLGSDYQLGSLSGGSELFASIQTGQQMFNLFGFLALFMGGFIIFNTFRTIVAERRHDIGMLRAVGASRGTIVGLFLAEGFLQGIVGTAIGMALGYLVGAAALGALSSAMQSYIPIQLGAPTVEPQVVAITLLLGVGITLLAGLLPARSASRVTPLEALRPTAGEVEFEKRIGKGAIAGLVLMALAVFGLLSKNPGVTALGGLAFLIGLVLVAPLFVRPIALVFGRLIEILFARQGTGALAEGNLQRQPSRAAITASATMIGLAIIVATVGLVSSLVGGILGVMQRSLGSDYLLMPPSVGVWSTDVGAGSALADKLRSVYGVGVVSSVRFAATTINDQQTNLLGIDPTAFPQVSGLNFQGGDARTAYGELANGRTVILNGPLAAIIGAKVGDNVDLLTPEGHRSYRVVGIAGDYLNAKISTAYTSQANLRTDFNKTEDVFIQINLAQGADPAATEARLKAIAANYPQFKFISGKAYYEENKALFDAVFASMYLILAVLALPSLIAMLNTLAIAVIERTREIGMLRAIGATRGQVSRTIIAEALLLAALGTAFGILAGLYLGYVMVVGMDASGIYPTPYSFPAAGILAGIAIGLLFGVIAALLPARQAARMDIIHALRYE